MSACPSGNTLDKFWTIRIVSSINNTENRVRRSACDSIRGKIRCGKIEGVVTWVIPYLINTTDLVNARTRLPSDALITSATKGCVGYVAFVSALQPTASCCLGLRARP